MSNEIRFCIISSARSGEILCKSSVKKLSPANSPNKKRKKTNSLVWLEEAYNVSRGETALWIAVITQAMMDALSRCKKSESLYHKHEATYWLTGNSKDFIDVCSAAGMDPDYVRLKAKRTLASPTPWRAEAGQGKRYQERKKYREQQQLGTISVKNKEKTQAEIINLSRG